MAIQAIIFDLGEVVFNCSFDRTFEYWATLTGENADALKQRFVFGDLFEAFERNDISPDEFRQDAARQLGCDISEEDFAKGWNAIYMDAVPGIDNLLNKLRQQYKLVALTNTNSVHATVWTGRYAELFVHFDKIFSSHEMRVRKPEAAAFRMVLDYLQLPAGEVLFLDDKEEYLAGAQRLGIETIQVTSFGQMVSDMEMKGVGV